MFSGACDDTKTKTNTKNQDYSNDTISILSCARNCEKHIRGTIKNMISIGNMFRDYSIYFYENNSQDKTALLLNRAASNNNKITVISKSIPPNLIKMRTWRLGYARQYLLTTLKLSNKNPDYVIVMDADDVANHSPFLGKQFIIEALKQKKHWDACFPPLTYDIWAYRFDKCMWNYWEIKIFEFMRRVAPNSQKLFKNVIRSYAESDVNYDKNGLQKVRSAFNGIGIYKYDIYCKGKYSGKNDFCSRLSAKEKDDIMKKNAGYFLMHPDIRDYYFMRLNEDCEHVGFHLSLGNSVRLRCCKTAPYPSVHSE